MQRFVHILAADRDEVAMLKIILRAQEKCCVFFYEACESPRFRVVVGFGQVPRSFPHAVALPSTRSLDLRHDKQ